MQLVFGEGWQAFDLAHCVVGQVADRAGGERRQAFDAGRLVATERVAQDGKDVAFDCRRLAAFGHGDAAPASHNALEGSEADERIAAHLLAAFDRFQQKALTLCPRRAQESRDRCFEVGQQGPAHGHKGMCPCQAQKLFAAGLSGALAGFHFLSVIAGAL